MASAALPSRERAPPAPSAPQLFLKRPAPRGPQPPARSICAGNVVCWSWACSAPSCILGAAGTRVCVGGVYWEGSAQSAALLLRCGRARILGVFSADTTGQQRAMAEVQMTSKAQCNQHRVGASWSCLKRSPPLAQLEWAAAERRRLGRGFSGLEK